MPCYSDVQGLTLNLNCFNKNRTETKPSTLSKGRQSLRGTEKGSCLRSVFMLTIQSTVKHDVEVKKKLSKTLKKTKIAFQSRVSRVKYRSV